jgi:hypothetical protein
MTSSTVLVKMIFTRIQFVNDWMIQWNRNAPQVNRLELLKRHNLNETDLRKVATHFNSILWRGRYGIRAYKKTFELIDILKRPGMTEEIVDQAWDEFTVISIHQS